MVTSSWVIAVGVVIGFGWVVLRTPAQQAVRTIDEGVWLLAGSLFGSRLGHVFVHWSYFRAHWSEIPQVWLGGLPAAGALAGGVAALFLLAVNRADLFNFQPGVCQAYTNAGLAFLKQFQGGLSYLGQLRSSGLQSAADAPYPSSGDEQPSGWRFDDDLR